MLAAFLLLAAPGVHAQAEDAGARLHAFFKAEWEYTLKENPVFASILGDRRYNDRWPDSSPAAFAARHQHALAAQKQLAAIPFAELLENDKVNYRLFRRELESQIEGHPYRLHLLAMNHMEGLQTVNDLVLRLRFATAKDYDDWIARLRTLPAYLDQNIALMREGIRAGIVQPKIIMQRVPAQVEKQFANRPEDSLFYKAFREFPPEIPEAERSRLRKEAQQAITEQVVPAYRALHQFLTREYLPACPEQIGIAQIPQGREAYAYLARSFTTIPLTPDEIHEIGLREVRRIRTEMEQVIAQTGFHGSFAEFLHFLRTDPQFYYFDPQELLTAYRALAKRIDPTLVKLFGRIPRIPYGVEPIPDTIAPDTTTAYYNEPAADGTHPGTYYVNLYKPEVRPKYEMEALSIHEAVPGHHLQIALAMELGELPEFRRYGGYTVFVEGWALYSESLGEELGFYKDPYSKFGQLTYEMWRAVRLVVDTGMHVKGWTREQAIEFFKANAAKTEQDIVNEIDRYIAWPGQALAYKIGELKIKELRARAAKELGERFDVRAFHDTVLGSGAVTLDVLEANVNAWIERVKQQAVSRSQG